MDKNTDPFEVSFGQQVAVCWLLLKAHDAALSHGTLEENLGVRDKLRVFSRIVQAVDSLPARLIEAEGPEHLLSWDDTQLIHFLDGVGVDTSL